MTMVTTETSSGPPPAVPASSSSLSSSSFPLAPASEPAGPPPLAAQAGPPPTAALVIDPSSIETLIPPTLHRLTDGLPIHELNLMLSESKECEVALQADIDLLEKALKSESLDPAEASALDSLLKTEFTPADRFFTISSLMGRLRHPLSLPLAPNSSQRAQQHHHHQQQQVAKRRNEKQTLDRYQTLLSLETHPEYLREHEEPTQLIAAWKRISSHRTAAVFRRSVNPKEAPGYTDRIMFPIDLQLIRKMISASIIRSYSDLHHKMMLICHNCVKFNGRESDYGIVTRDFETHVEEVLLQLVFNTAAPPPPPPPTTTTTTPINTPVPAECQPVAPASATTNLRQQDREKAGPQRKASIPPPQPHPPTPTPPQPQTIPSSSTATSVEVPTARIARPGGSQPMTESIVVPVSDLNSDDPSVL